MHEHVSAGLLLLHQEHVLRMQRDALDLAGEEAGQPPGGARRDELRVVCVEVGGAQISRPISQLKPPTPPPVAREPLALEVRGGLHARGHDVGLRQARRRGPRSACP